MFWAQNIFMHLYLKFTVSAHLCFYVKFNKKNSRRFNLLSNFSKLYSAKSWVLGCIHGSWWHDILIPEYYHLKHTKVNIYTRDASSDVYRSSDYTVFINCRSDRVYSAKGFRYNELSDQCIITFNQEQCKHATCLTDHE